MKVDTTKLLQLIAAKPRIRTMELADQLNHDIDDIDDALAPLLESGAIVPIPVIAPSGRSATGYQLSEPARAERIQSAPGVSIDGSSIDRAIDFITERGTARGAELHAYLGLKPNELVSRELAPARDDGRLVMREGNWTLGGPKAEPEPAPVRITNTDKAVEFLRGQPGYRATSGEMRVALSMAPGAQVAPFLKRGLEDGRLARDGQDWLLGGEPLDSVVAVGNIIVASKDASPIPQAVVDAVAAAPAVVRPAAPVDSLKSTVVGDVFVSSRSDAAFEAAVAAIAAAPSEPAPVVAVQSQPAAPVFRCGIWSDNVIELQRDGETIAKLTRHEGEHTADFLARMWGKAEQVAA